MAKTATKERHLNPAEYTILVFGGVSRISRLLNLNKSTVSKWKHYQAVPRKNHLKLLEVAKQKRIALTAKDLILGRTLNK